MRHVGGGTPADLDRTRAMLLDYSAHQRLHGFSVWAVLERETGALIADAGLHRTDGADGEVELGYTLGRAWWGRGYATEAAAACRDAAFGELGLDELIALVDPLNAPSVHVLDKIGMSPAGRRMAYGREHLLYRLRAAPAAG